VNIKKIIKSKSDEMFIFLAIPMVVIWEYYIGYLIASIIGILFIRELYNNNIKEKKISKISQLAIYVTLSPILIIVGLSIFLHNYEWFKFIEGGSFVLFIIISISDSYNGRRMNKEKEKDLIIKEEKEKQNLLVEKENFNISRNLIAIKQDVDLIAIYREMSDYDDRIVGSILLNEESNLEYIYIKEFNLLKIIILDTKETFDFNLDLEVLSVACNSSVKYRGEQSLQLLLRRYVKSFIEFYDKGASGYLEKEPKYGLNYSNQYIIKGISSVLSKNLFYKEQTIDNFIITKYENKYSIIMSNRVLTPSGLALPGSNNLNKDFNTKDKIFLRTKLEEKVGKNIELTLLNVSNEEYPLYELRGSVNTKLVYWYGEIESIIDYRYSREDLPDNLFVPISEIKNIIDTGIYIKGEEKYVLVPHQIEVLSLAINEMQKMPKLQEYLRDY
jgi:hypothetical protein